MKQVRRSLGTILSGLKVTTQDGHLFYGFAVKLDLQQKVEFDPHSFLCSRMEETIDNLSFDFMYSKLVWENLLTKMGITRTSGPWRSELAWILGNVKGKTLASVMFKLALAGIVSHIWHERNVRGKLKTVRQFYAL